MSAVIEILGLLINVLVMLVIAQFVIGMLFAFNIISQSNQFAFQIYHSINALLDPILKPIRKILPQTGTLDFSPLVLILLLHALMAVLSQSVT